MLNSMSFHPKFTNRNWVTQKLKTSAYVGAKNNNFYMYKRETEYIRDHMQRPRMPSTKPT